MLKRLISNIHRQRSYRSFKNKDYLNAIDRLKKVEKYRALKTPEKAFYATLQIGANNSKAAQKIFNEVLHEIDKNHLPKDNDNIRYVKLYSKLYLSLIRKTDDHLAHFEKLRKITPSAIISEYLPLPDSDFLTTI